MKFEFVSKAHTLAYLENKLVHGIILPQYVFTIKDFRDNESLIYQTIQKKFSCIIVRSSCLSEDLIDCSNAGAFDSILNVNCQTVKELKSAITSVINSYTDQNDSNEVLIQPFLENTESSGVAFTADPDTLASYFVINYDLSGSTDSITSGNSKTDKTLVVLKGKSNEAEFPNYWIANLIKTMNEIEKLLCQDALDIEFGVSEKKILIFQVGQIVKN